MRAYGSAAVAMSSAGVCLKITAPAGLLRSRLAPLPQNLPMRPNPIALTVAQILYVDYENGVVGISYIDALPGTPVPALKPYTPSLDRVGKPEAPDWRGHWPVDLETSGDFDWEKEFLF